jgi:hypothetical protein
MRMEDCMTWMSDSERAEAADIAELRRELRAELTQMRVEIARNRADAMQWSLTFAVSAATVMAIFVAVLG